MGDCPPVATTALDVPGGMEYAFGIRAEEDRGVAGSEVLARRYFVLFGRGEIDEVLELMHPEIEIVLKTTRPGEVLRGLESVVRFVQEEVSERVYETVAEVYRPLDADRIVVEGRIRWTDEDRILRDDPVIWALEFRDGLLYRSTPAQTVLEAETTLSAPHTPTEGPSPI